MPVPTSANYRRIIARYGLAVNVPTLQTGEIGFDTDTLVGRIGDNTSTPPKIMTTKSTGALSFAATSVQFNNILIPNGGKVGGVNLASQNQATGLVFRSAISGDFRNVSFTSPDSSIVVDTSNTDTTSSIGIRLNQALADGIAFAKLGPWMAVLGIAISPPVSPVEGDVYLVGASATGAFAGHDHEIVIRTTSGWAFKSVLNRTLARLPNGSFYERTGAGWIPFSIDGAHSHAIADVTGLQAELDSLGSSSGEFEKFNHYMEAVVNPSSNYSASSLNPILTTYRVGMVVYVKTSGGASTGASTFKINALASKPLVRSNGANIADGDLPNNCIFVAVYDGTSFRVLSILYSTSGVAFHEHLAADITDLPAAVNALIAAYPFEAADISNFSTEVTNIVDGLLADNVSALALALQQSKEEMIYRSLVGG